MIRKLRRVVPVIGAAFIVVLVWRDTPERLVLATQGVATDVVVTGKRDEHRVLVYEYIVAGTHYAGEDRAGDHGVSPYEEITVGTHIPGTYAASRPDWSTLGSPSDRLIQTLAFNLAASVGCAIFAVAFWRVRGGTYAHA